MADTGWTLPRSGSTFLVGFNPSWNNESKITEDDNVPAYCSFNSGSQSSSWLVGDDFGFSIPTGATIDGIEAKIQMRENFGTLFEDYINLQLSDGSTGSENKSSGAGLGGSYADFTYGGSSDLWSETWTASDINDADFGLRLRLITDVRTISARGDVDYMALKVYYTESTGVANQVVSTTFF